MSQDGTDKNLNLLQRAVVWLARVTAVPVGRPDDGVTRPIFSAGSEIDPDWAVLRTQIEDARAAWRQNPLARRLVGLITSYCIGDGIRLSSSWAAQP